MSMQAKNSVGFNTPGAASSAADLAPSWRPTSLQNRGRNPQKSMLKNNIFLTSILEGSGRRFGRVFGRIFGRKMHEHYQKMFLAKSLKITLPCRRERDIQESESYKKNKNRAKIEEKTHVFWDIDFEGVLGGFWEAFGTPKSSIFAFFVVFFRIKF